ncbi:hypothetical protein E2562_006273 [Oryza meyeriana var. granulata]|uniref:Uncharacterized protein n=1 Tax=Oryza meyeriana var. granulata TaxID=110450 RepID=A0A6G1EFJ9_9ORYZ|nr:hypothetical protein E2562_006273 [Oryza meyeriana var. granulata]
MAWRPARLQLARLPRQEQQQREEGRRGGPWERARLDCHASCAFCWVGQREDLSSAAGAAQRAATSPWEEAYH